MGIHGSYPPPLPPDVRQLSSTALIALDLLQHLNTRPHLYRDLDGRGHPALKIRYRANQQRPWRAHYIGNLPATDEAIIRDYCAARWPDHPVKIALQHLADLRIQRRGTAQDLRACAQEAGGALHGYLLVGRALHDHHPRLAILAHQLHQTNLTMQAIVASLLTDPGQLSVRQHRRLTSAQNALQKAVRRSAGSLSKLPPPTGETPT